LKRLECKVLSRAAHVLCSSGLGSRVQRLAPMTQVAEWRFPVEQTVPSLRADALRRCLGIAPAARVVLYAGNFSGYQGIELLFDAFEQAASADPHLFLVCVGAANDGEANALRMRLSDHIRSRAQILPRVPHQEIPGYLAMAECLVSLRPQGNNLPLKLFDYMAANRPIVATRGQAHALIGSGRGFFCDATAASVAGAIEHVFSHPLQARARASSASEHARHHFGWRSFVWLVGNVYRSVLLDHTVPVVYQD
jgi:glycosyltransferase involved in cell wall biosynthesis